MKLLRYGPRGAEKPGLLDQQGRIRDLSSHVAEINSKVLAPERLAALSRLETASLPLVEGSPRLGIPVSGIGKIVAIGLNYLAHGDEVGVAEHKRPKEPLIFSKHTTSLNGPNDPVMMPRDASKVDWEVELAVVIGRKAQYIEETAALDHVAGYAVLNDVSERAFQLERAGQWVKGKSSDTFCPLGPWLVTRDEITDPQSLGLWLEVNGERRQSGNTRNMVFGVATLVSYLSRFMTLMPGDVIATGTPSGVGMAMNPPQFLKAGDVMRLGVEGLGEQRQEVVAFKMPS